MAKQFDLIVLGTGVGAATVATRCRKAGWDVAVVDVRPYGGTCALRGCDPKKVLVGAAHVVDAAHRLAQKGLEGGLRITWPELMRFKRSFTEPVPASREEAFLEAGIATFHGLARFVGPTAVEVNGERLDARYVHIATGAKPAPLPIRGAACLTTSDQFLELDQLPRRIVFLGSGYIGFELAHVSARAGADVALLDQHDRPLSEFDPDLVSLLVERTRAMGVNLRLGTRIEGVEQGQDGLVVHTASKAGAGGIEADLVVHSAGRVPEVAALDLEAAGVAYGERGVIVNGYMQSVSNPAVYAAGDAAEGGLPLTPVASFEADIAASNLCEGNHRKREYPPIPSVVFTLPPLASVGLREDEARESGRPFRVQHGRTSQWYSSRRVGEDASGYKVLVEEQTDKILGAHVLGPGADELINLFTMAMRCGMTTRQIKESIFAYPTRGSDLAHML